MLKFESMTNDPQRSRLRKITSLVLEALVLIVAFIAISAYQARNLLATDGQAAPSLIATTLDGAPFDLSELVGRPALIYFFEPECPYCAASADNLVRLRRWREKSDLDILAVALMWDSKVQIETYVEKHDLNVPVILADSAVASDWNIYGFPTYYVLDGQHRVLRRALGYSTQLGLWWRSLVPNP